MAKALARTIKSKRDYQAAKSAAETLREQTAKESAAERRLQALLHEIEKFDGDEDLGDDDGDIAEDVGGFRRRWSDED
ncbi:MAG TPA: hypothetical protein VFZ14_15180 [Burkholderiales bacterium]|nr:hypothetical protein [Burkholderiales bacterium]